MNILGSSESKIVSVKFGTIYGQSRSDKVEINQNPLCNSLDFFEPWVHFLGLYSEGSLKKTRKMERDVIRKYPKKGEIYV